MRIVKIKTSKDIIDSMSLEQLKEYARTIKTENLALREQLNLYKQLQRTG